MREVRPGLRRRRTPGQFPLAETPYHPHRAHEEIPTRRQDVGAGRDQSAEKAQDVLRRRQLEAERGHEKPERAVQAAWD